MTPSYINFLRIPVEIIDTSEDLSEVRICVWDYSDRMDAIVPREKLSDILKNLKEKYGRRLDIQYYGKEKYGSR